MKATLLVPCLGILLLAGCSGGAAQGGDNKPVSSLDLPVEGDAQAKAVAQAQRTLATEMGITDASVAIVSVEEVTWNDASLGCPKPDESYAQVMIPGYTIMLTTDGGPNVTYHAGVDPNGAVTVVKCEKPAIAGSPSLGGPALDLAKADLTKRLGEAAGSPEVTDAFIAPVFSLICDDEISDEPLDESAPRKAILEFHLKAADGNEYVYRSWADEIKYCGTVGELILK